MRHLSLDLTMNVYTDPSLLDVEGALEALPEPQPGAPTATPFGSSVLNRDFRKASPLS
jgi:hypothetical protein